MSADLYQQMEAEQQAKTRRRCVFLNPHDLSKVMKLAKGRNAKQQRFGAMTYGDRRGGLEAHVIGLLAENAMARLLGCVVDRDIYEFHGDDGIDLQTSRHGKIGVKMTTYLDEPYLRVETEHFHEDIDIYVLCAVNLSSPREVHLIGYATREEVRQAPKRQFVKGGPLNYVLDEHELRDPAELLPKVFVCGPKDPAPKDAFVINTTSRATNWARGLSPFVVGPIMMPDGVSRNMENAWQYSKLYAQHATPSGDPTEAYWEWRRQGWQERRAHRYPMGKEAKPICSLWQGKKLSYTEAREHIYVPLYAHNVQGTAAFNQLRKEALGSSEIWLWDFDGYNHKAIGSSYEQVVKSENRKCGHSFVLAALLEGEMMPGLHRQGI